MATYERAGHNFSDMADELIKTVEPLNWIREVGVKIDYVWAYGARDEDGKLVGEAIKHHGVKALGLCRIVSLKDRAKGLGDCEIVLDKDWWDTVDDEERRAVIDHELTHLQLKKGTDDLGRPKLKLRKHDHQFGFFTSVAQRHGQYSQERIQAASMLEEAGQFYWPSLIEQQGTVTIKSGNHQATMPLGRFSSIAKAMAKPA